MIITKIQLCAMERVRIPEDERKDFYLYVDEFQNFATDSFKNILSEARKYRLNLTMAHQYIGQLVTDTSTAVRDAVFGNVGTMISFRVGAADAEYLETEFTPEFEQNDLIRLDNYNIYLKLMIDGITSRPFSATTIAPAPVNKDDKVREEIIKSSRSKYSRKVSDVESEINRWASSMEVPVRGASGQQQNKKSGSSKTQGQTQGQSGQAGRVQPDGTTLYDAVCSNCNKPTKVVFPPTEGRPVFCKSCLKKMKNEKQVERVVNANAQSTQDEPEDVNALAGLGIEFESPKVVSFNSRRPDKNTKDRSTPVKQKKEVNLSDLKQALAESLGKKPEDSKEELEERVDEEEYEDKAPGDDN
jgi:CxxC-x17-CxxC domain-containing protein